MNRFRKNEKGFTLVELLIVVAIIGILAAIAIPQFIKYKKNAAASACESDLRNCMSEAGGRFANNSQDNSTDCDAALPGNKFPAWVIVQNNGSMTIGSDATTEQNPRTGITTYGASYLIDASIVNNSADCNVTN